MKNIEYQGKHFRLALWDTDGQDQFRQILPMFLRGADTVLLVYDVCRRQSLEDLEYHIEMIREQYYGRE